MRSSHQPRAVISRRMRRVVMAAGAALVVMSAVRLPLADVGEVEVSGYEGYTAGEWACGPRGDVRYGGVAAGIRYSQARATATHGRGAHVVLQTAAEVAHVKVRSETEPLQVASSDTQPFFGVGGRFGYHWRWFGFDLGMVGWNGWRDETHTRYFLMPNGALRLGAEDTCNISLGLGVPQVTWVTRPAFPYLRVSCQAPQGVRVEGVFGKFRAGPGLLDTGTTLFGVAWFIPMAQNLNLRANLALGHGIDFDRQAGLGLVYEY